MCAQQKQTITITPLSFNASCTTEDPPSQLTWQQRPPHDVHAGSVHAHFKRRHLLLPQPQHSTKSASGVPSRSCRRQGRTLAAASGTLTLAIFLFDLAHPSFGDLISPDTVRSFEETHSAEASNSPRSERRSLKEAATEDTRTPLFLQSRPNS